MQFSRYGLITNYRQLLLNTTTKQPLNDDLVYERQAITELQSDKEPFTLMHNNDVLNDFSNIGDRSEYLVTHNVSALPVSSTCKTMPKYQFDNSVHDPTDLFQKDTIDQLEPVNMSTKSATDPFFGSSIELINAISSPLWSGKW